MPAFSTREAAKKLGITAAALSRYIKDKKVPAPQVVSTGKASMHVWTEAEIEHVRQLLPKIANGRKARYKKRQSAPTARRGRLSGPGAHGTGQQSAKARTKTRSKKKK